MALESFESVREYVEALCAVGKKILAIKLVRAATNLPVKFAKEMVDRLNIRPNEPRCIERPIPGHRMALETISGIPDEQLGQQSAYVMREIARSALEE